MRMKVLTLLIGMSGAVQAAGIMDLSLPNLLPLTNGSAGTASVLLTQARDALSGVKGDTDAPWPCQGQSVRMGEFPANAGAFAAQFAGIKSQGFVLTKQVNSSTGVHFLARHPAGMNLIGSYQNATATTPALFVVCERADVWTQKPEPPIPARAAQLGDFNARVNNWNLGRMSVRMEAATVDSTIATGRGVVNANGDLNIQLPYRPNRLALLDAAQLLPALGRQAGCTGRLLSDGVKYGDGQVAVITQMNVLNVPFENSATAVMLAQAPVQAALVSTRLTGSYKADLSLVFASKAMKVSGTLLCEDTQKRVDVQLNLPGGWSPIELVTFSSGQQVLRHALPGAVRSWQVVSVLPPAPKKAGSEGTFPGVGAYDTTEDSDVLVPTQPKTP